MPDQTPPPASLRKKLSEKNAVRFILTIGTVIVSTGILGMLVYQQRNALRDYEWQIRVLPLILSFALFSAAFLMVIIVWVSMMTNLGIQLPFRKHFRHYSVANLTKRIPGTIWYVASRAQLYKEDGISRRQTALLSGVEVAVSLVAGIIVSLVFGLSIMAQYNVSFWVLVLALLGSCLVLHPRLLGWVMKRLGADIRLFRYNKLLKWIIGYIFVWLMGGLILFAICNTFWPLSIEQMGYAIGSWALVGVLSNILFFSPSNLGITEVGLSLLLSNIMPASIAVLVSIATRILIFLYEIIWALIALAIRGE